MEDLHNRWHHRWMTPKAESFNSKIHGIGLRAKEDISKGEIVGVIGGIVVPTSEIKEYRAIMGDLGVQISDDFWIVPSTRKEVEIGGAINHSCNPNLGIKGEIMVIAIKEIKKGEELIIDYGLYHSTMDSFKCNCDSENCRKIITKNDWKIKELQEKYGKYFASYLKEKINSPSY
jgi:SET domain-containing protein